MSCLQWDWTTNRLSIKCAEFAMSDYGVLDYIPVIGDIYRYGKLGWNIGSWLANDGDSYNNRVLSSMVDSINQAANSDDAIEALGHVNDAIELIHQIDTDSCKKYQVAIFFYLGARIFHILALCECIIHSDNLKELKSVGKTFSEAKRFCNKVWEVDKTIFTSNRSMIDQIRTSANEKKEEISESRKKWRKQYRHLYKQEKPVKWYLGMWIFA